MKSSTAQRWLTTHRMVNELYDLSVEDRVRVKNMIVSKLRQLGWYNIEGIGFYHEKSLKKIRPLTMA